MNKTQEIYQKLQENPQSAEIHFKAALMYIEQDNITSALRYLEKAIELNPDFEEAKNKLKEIKPI